VRGISQKQFASQQRISPARVSQWIKSGIISTLSDGSIDPIEAERDLLKNRDGSKRLDWEYRMELPKKNPNLDGPPPPFTGNYLRDVMIISIVSLYDYFLQGMVRLQLKLLRELGLTEKSAKGVALCFAFSTHDLFKSFVEKDLLKKFLLEKLGEDIDSIQSQHFGSARRVKTFPPKDFQLYHPKVVLDILKELGPDWPFEVAKKKKTTKGVKVL
jgi:hypothetical protein